jgi:cell division protein FtsW
MKTMKQKNDIVLVAVVTILLTIGIVMIFSASAVMAHEKHGSLLYYYFKQILWGFLCLVAIFIFSRIKISSLTKGKIPLTLVIISVIFLIGLFIWGEKVNGAKRWYSFGLVSFQPSEFAKIALILYFAHVFARKKSSTLRDWKKGLLPLALIFMLIIIPIYFQPDLGMVIMISLIASIMTFLSNVRFKHVLGAFIFILPAFLLKINTSAYQVDRIKSWITNLSNPLGSGYQIKQSLISLGNGGMIGSGIGRSKQKFFFLPDSHTDFIFSILGEELGFLGTSVVLILFLIILWRGISIAKNAATTFDQYMAVGLTMNLVLYGFMNAAVTTMLIPTTGMPMPFISYGGSFLLSIGISVGILMNIARNKSSLQGRVEDIRNERRDLYNTLILSRQ